VLVEILKKKRLSQNFGYLLKMNGSDGFFDKWKVILGKQRWIPKA
jgi:hypothetical protein